MFSTEQYKSRLNTKFLGHSIIYKFETQSTNIDAWDNIGLGCDEGTLIITEKQLFGRGRRQNRWISSDGNSLTFSFILFPKNNLNQIGLLPLLTGVSIVKGILESSHIEVKLKWPNDIMINHRKIGGILIETKTSPTGLMVVIGIGININEKQEEFPISIKNTATSLKAYANEIFNRENILAEILNSFENLYTNKWKDVISMWRSYCIHNNTTVCFNTEEGKFQGIFKDITKDGHAELIINNKIKIFTSGMVIT